MASLKDQLKEAERGCDYNWLRLLLDNGVNKLRNSDLTLNEILAYAVLADHVPCIRDCLEGGATVTHEVNINAIGNSTLEAYKLLVPAGLNVNEREGSDGALGWAINARDMPFITFLLQSGALPYLGGIDRESPLMLAIHDNLPSVVKLLMDYDPYLDEDDLLLTAIFCADVEIIECLLENGLDANEWTDDTPRSQRWPVLHLAVTEGRLDVVEALLRYGADVEAKDSNGKTALEKAIMIGREDIANVLKGSQTSVSERAQK